MMPRRAPSLTAAVFAGAACCYAANCMLGVSAALRPAGTNGLRWLHHALYVATATLTAAALSSAFWGVPRDRGRRAALALLPAALPLAALPSSGTRTRRHPVLALTAAPFFIAGVIRSR